MSIEPYNTVGGMGYIYDQDNDSFDMIRVMSINDDGKYKVKKVDEKTYHIILDSEEKEIDKDELSKYSFLEPDAILTLNNVNMVTDDKGKVFRDIMIMMFTPSSNGVFEFVEPKLLARQLLDNPYDESREGKCGFSYSKDDLEAVDGFMDDLLYSESIIDKRMACMYKTDNVDDIVSLLDNEKTQEIFSDLFVHCADPNDDKGFCRNLKDFIVRYGVLYDARLNLGISYIDMELGENTRLDDESKWVLSVLYSINVIDRSLVTKFSYEIELDQIKMPYFMVYDSNDTLYVVAYTKCKEELLKAELKTMEDNNELIYSHIRNIANNMVNNEM
nr:MAG TPA: hypothetical protein [Caudoviricetes sp.]